MIEPGEAGSLLLIAVVDMSPAHPDEGRQYEDPDRQSLRTRLGDAAPTTRVIEISQP